MTQGVLRMVTETNELIVNPVGNVIRFRGKVGSQDQVESLFASNPMALDTLTYIAQHFTEVHNRGTLKIFERKPTA